MQLKLNKLSVKAEIGNELNILAKIGQQLSVKMYVGYSTVSGSYNQLSDKPRIENVELVGNKTLSQLNIEQKKGLDDYYVNGAEKNMGAMASGLATPSPISSINLSNVNKIAFQVDELSNDIISDVLIPAGTGSITITADRLNRNLSDLNLQCVEVYFSGSSNNDSVTRTTAILRINNISTNYLIGSIVDTGFYFYVHGVFYNKIQLEVINSTAYYFAMYRTSQKNGSSLAQGFLAGNKAAVADNKITRIDMIMGAAQTDTPTRLIIKKC